jgi:serine/threonine protein kinase
VKLVDFGVAISARTGQREPTHIAGKHSYMAPEQRVGRSLDARADLFSLGVVLYELLVDERPFDSGADATTFVPVTRRRADLPPGIDVVLGKLLAPTPEGRYADGQQVVEAIARLASGVGIDVSGTWLRATLPTLFPRGLEEPGFDPDGALQHTMDTPRSDSFSLSPVADPARMKKLPPPPAASVSRSFGPEDTKPARNPPSSSAPRPEARALTPPPEIAPTKPTIPRAALIVALLAALALLGFLWTKF